MPRRRIASMRFPVPLIDAVDVARGDLTRTRFVERAIEAALNGHAPKLDDPEPEAVRDPRPGSTPLDGLPAVLQWAYDRGHDAGYEQAVREGMSLLHRDVRPADV